MSFPCSSTVSKRSIGMSLDTYRRAALITEVDALVERVRLQAPSAEEARKVLDMTNFALTYLRRHTPDALRLLLDIPHATTTVQNYWQEFGGHLRPTLSRLEVTYPEPPARWEALLYFLGWLHRVRRGPAGDSRGSRQTARDTVTPISPPDTRKRDPENRPSNRPPALGEFSVKLGSLLKQPVTPPPATAPIYRRGDRVQVTVITSGINGMVRLPDGIEIRDINLYGVKEGTTITVRIVDVTGDGKVKRVVR
jgi:hypothetical protein